MEYRTLLKANLKRHKNMLFGVFLLILPVSAALGTVLSVWLNSSRYVRAELCRAGFGALTAWVSNVPDMDELVSSMNKLEPVERVAVQDVLYSDYAVNGQDSDSEGQLIPYGREDNRYLFFTEDLSSYLEETPEITPGEVYVSPSMVSMFGIKTGDEICFSIVRGQPPEVFTVRGFYEDPFMGSSMIGMKGFLIDETDSHRIREAVREAGIDALARDGAMLHIFQSADDPLSVSQLNSMINTNTRLPEYMEFLHSADAISGFMLILQNAFGGLMAAFAAVLLTAALVVLGHSIGSSVEDDYVNMGILKTIGFTGGKLRRIQMLQYLISILGGMGLGILLAVFLSRIAVRTTLTVTGIRIPSVLPLGACILCYSLMISLIAGFLAVKTGKINQISPMKAIRGEAFSTQKILRKGTLICQKNLVLCLAFRQLVSGARRYAGACTVAVFLVFFASMTGRMATWLGVDGKGMMDAFNPADHDIGVQVFGRSTDEEAEEIIRAYTGITDQYLLAMPGVSVSGIDYTANVISDPERFHILEGRTSLNDHEIVLTGSVAANLGVSVGGTVTVQADKGSAEYVISGIYACANDMGDNVGMSREGYLKIGQDNPDIWCSHYFLEDTEKKAAVMEALKDAFGGDIHVHENTWPGLFGIISAMQALLIVMYGMAAVFILIVTSMTGSRILSTEQRDIGIYKAIGFTSGQLRQVFALRFTVTAAAGSVIGTILASVLTDPLISFVMKRAGIGNFSSRPTAGNTLVPSLTVILMFAGFAYMVSWRVKKTDLTVLINE